MLGVVGTLANVAGFTAAFRAPHAAFAGAALLFALTPPVLSRLGAAGTPEAASGGLARLTRAERKVLDLLLTDLSYQEIANRLSLSPNTVKYHVRNIYRKAGCSSRQELCAACGRVDAESKQDNALPPDDFSRRAGERAGIET
ncbi:helix-turn-helix domain-containing protein [Neomoorella glycerini]|uniref:helix-turn-helix domain-containing protein n=1 Tax=Neomoorella glycerini TaxID=55779 RepID=UPI001B8B2519|nr:helix-turn-helix transcriptional regulator [Moorella glycerini]